MALLLRSSRMPQIKMRPQQFQQGQSFSLPAPYGGLNLREDITALKPNEARVLENLFPSSGQIVMREGFSDFGTGLGSGETKTLATFNAASASYLIAGANGKLFNVSSSGSGSELATSFTEDRWQTEVYNGRLHLVNGVDAPQGFDGSTVSATSWSGSGLTITNLVNVGLARNRLWFCENDSADVWYGDAGAVQGTLTKFQLSQIANGGKCMAIGAWSRDAGDGADDLTVFVFSTGEILIYQGDPASTFSLQGRYMGAPPIGRQCLIKIGGELVVITRLGFLPVSAAVGGVALDLSRIDPWGKIAPLVVQDAKIDGGNAGWHGCLHEGVVYINVPQSPGAVSKHYVLNTRNGAWTIYSGWNASSFASYNDELYFGAQTGGLVNKVGGPDDDGEDITAFSNGAFVTPGGAGRGNLFTAIRPVIKAEGAVSGLIGVDTDYVVRSLVGAEVELVADASTTPWGSPWGSPWGQPNQSQPQWFSIQGSGRTVSVRMRITGRAQNFEWYATDLMEKPGGVK